MRIEKDAFGTVEIQSYKQWGIQTERARTHFAIGKERMPLELIYALAGYKKAAAYANYQCNKLSEAQYCAITEAIDEVLSQKWDAQFPLSIFQSGSGTQTNMNLNEVIARRASAISGLTLHPNDHVNASQSTNDAFSCAMHIAVVTALETKLLPTMRLFAFALKKKQKAFAHIKKIGRTHLQDAVSLTLGEEFSAYAVTVEEHTEWLNELSRKLLEIPAGGTAVGTGLNAPETFDQKVVGALQKATGFSFSVMRNKFYGIAMHDALVQTSGALKVFATSLFKIANDIRWLGSGPHCGLGELILPANEPGSSIMPGKINPTQCEAMLMVVMQVFGHDTAISFSHSQGNFELNTAKPLIITLLLKSIELLNDAMRSFEKYLLKNLQADPKRIQQYLEQSLMEITALTPEIGYDQASKIIRDALANKTDLKTTLSKIKP